MTREFQDRLFQLCKEDRKFGEYITKIHDLEECPNNEIINEYFEKITMDSLFRSPSLDILVNIEHQSQITNSIMFRNLKYFVTTKDKHKKEVKQFIFYTGKKQVPTWYVYDKQVYHQPYLMQTCLHDGLETFKKIKNKVNTNQNISPFDIYDLVWIPCFGKIETDNEFLKEYIDIISKLKTHEYYNLLERVVIGWAVKINIDKEIIEYLKEKLDMNPLDSPEFIELITTATNERELEKKDAIIAEKNIQIKEIINEKDKQLNEKNIQLNEKDKQINKLKQELKTLQSRE
jgi:hypothetical protein